MEEIKANPFQELSELFINNQNSMNREVHNLRSSLRNAKEKFERLIEELERDPFSAELNLLLGIDVFSMKILEEENEPTIVGPGSIIHVNPGEVHRFGATDSPVMLCEVSTPELEDVIRIKDDYKR